ncbi:hypothetical protein NDU88_002637 [Pleurodeles waltl]|uniref:Uncharacterized protein n=1 Tax=Pleurodeles waltl TaxID=8319 RepID=A0AAV7KTC4_PLEWA|nr:hypothetical protein NDU88_002637 [Pleurodeles waltl]
MLPSPSGQKKEAWAGLRRQEQMKDRGGWKAMRCSPRAADRKKRRPGSRNNSEAHTKTGTQPDIAVSGSDSLRRVQEEPGW